MAEIIKDGRTGDTAKVDVNNRLHTNALSVDIILSETLNNNAYDISTNGLITLTTDTESALIYLKNNGDSDLVVTTVFLDSIASTGGVGAGSLKWYMNPDGGTIVDDASEALTINRRIGSPNNISADRYKATGVGKTLTNGATINFPVNAGISTLFGKPFVVPKGQRFGVSYTPPAGNSSMGIQIGLLVIVDTTTTL
jgi:hypothetical protein